MNIFKIPIFSSVVFLVNTTESARIKKKVVSPNFKTNTKNNISAIYKITPLSTQKGKERLWSTIEEGLN